MNPNQNKLLVEDDSRSDRSKLLAGNAFACAFTFAETDFRSSGLSVDDRCLPGCRCREVGGGPPSGSSASFGGKS